MDGAELRWRALGTSVHLLVTDPERAEAARVAVRSVLDMVDASYSRFRDDSELSRAMSRPGAAVRVSPLLGHAIEVALRAARLTDGAVDPTVGAAMRAIGYDRDLSEVRGRPAPLAIRLERVPGWQAVRYDAAHRVLRPRADVELDLGSTGKALAADLAARAAVAATGGGGVLVNLGGDIATAGDAPTGGWRVLVADDSATPPDSGGEVIAVSAGGVATSSTTVRRWNDGAGERHHIVDPVTGAPAGGPWRTVTVAAADCVDANTAATAAIVRGAAAVEWLERLGLPARLVTTDGQIVRVAGWPVPAAVSTQEHIS